MNGVELGIFLSRMEAICDEMGVVLQRAAFSPNIKDRLDFSCALFDDAGELVAQAAHIPVHLGSMAFAMKSVVSQLQWQAGDMVVMNDPYKGGTHLPDVTVIAPLFVEDELIAFVVNRAHHANIGSSTPGSMPLSKDLHEEGVVIEPIYLYRQNQLQIPVLATIASLKTSELNALEQHGNLPDNPSVGDFMAQASACRVGVKRLSELVGEMTIEAFQKGLGELNQYSERLARACYEKIPDGTYAYVDVMDDDGQGQQDIQIKTEITVKGSDIYVDFAGTAEQVNGNINAPLSVAAAAVFYVFRCLLPDNAPQSAGIFRPIELSAPLGCLLNARYPAAVAAGNVETSTRVVDVVLGALAQAIPEQIPAASHGSMNNMAMGKRASGDISGWDYYETIGGGMGAYAKGPGLNGVQTHMTNTYNTPIESLEMHYPMRVKRYGLRWNSGGEGQFCGGEGIVRELEFLAPAQVTLLTERRSIQPWGLQGGEGGKAGVNLLNGEELPAKVSCQVEQGDVLTLMTPGGGGYGKKK